MGESQGGLRRHSCFFHAGPASGGERFVEALLAVSCAATLLAGPRQRNGGGLLPSRGRTFTLPALMTSGARLRIKETQRLTLGSANAVATWPVRGTGRGQVSATRWRGRGGTARPASLVLPFRSYVPARVAAWLWRAQKKGEQVT
ncbi:hypothetical protein [Streptomyces sp. YS-3]|uniref:hypothetical protein n=1 Tax=Streptomyces sp. YS-3 TaxID=3381352 RepID=UPI003862A06A